MIPESRPREPEPATAREILDVVSTAFVGDRLLLKKVLAAAIANGHVAFQDDPGLGKTLLVKSFARAIGCKATRIQFTPDLLPNDVTGTRVWDPSAREFKLVRGPIFTHVLLADEINRAPPKTQSALLEAMSERQVTIEGETLELAAPFLVLATMNPLEEDGTYPLPVAQWDRFLLRLSVGYPRDRDDEAEILRRRVAWRRDDPTPQLAAAVDRERFLSLQARAEDVYVNPLLLDWISDLVRAVRERPEVEAGPSPRGGLALLRVARGLAVVEGRGFVVPDDVRAIAVDALAHRVVLTEEAALHRVDAREVVAAAVAEATPPAAGPPIEVEVAT